MSYRVIVEKSAKIEIKEAALWIAQYSPERAMLWYFDLEEAFGSLKNFPARCSLAPENKHFQEEMRHLLIGKYRIIFTIRDERVHILHIRHSSRKTLTPEEEAETDSPDENADE